jgi:uncharacterized protein (DUF2132 family)
MAEQQLNNPLHGITLETILNRLIEKIWLGRVRKANPNSMLYK